MDMDEALGQNLQETVKAAVYAWLHTPPHEDISPGEFQLAMVDAMTEILVHTYRAKIVPERMAWDAWREEVQGYFASALAVAGQEPRGHG
jgi:hypothetical protein